MAASITDLQQKCWEAALHAYGTAHIFQRRAVALKRKNDALSYVGLVVPVLVGGLAGTFGQADLWSVGIAVAAVVGVAQMAVNLWALIKQWPGELSYSSASSTANESLARRFTTLAANPPAIQAMQAQFNMLEVEDHARRAMDNEKAVTEKERRRGMRAALRQYQRPCVACSQVPTTMDPSGCGVCGKF
ncbi:mobilome CxxCx(11)CxxC protein [Streptomyces sp. NPDC006864]|uniref:mobilome CxxCx(11)CxxC protein n=1 Tax=Streptomyces sp. NPDC006864 TaxID=3154780 RepID=UPI003453D490